MPKGTYENKKVALNNAKLIMKKTRCDAVKLESNKKNYKIIKSLVNRKNSSHGTYWLYTTI